jgi:predicted transcriptional regulator
MPNSKDFFERRAGRAVLISLLPKYAQQIVTGKKRVEFRRTWTRKPVALLALYATSPVSRVIGVAHVRRVIEAPPTALWRFAQEYSGGISRRQLYSYLEGKRMGFALLLGCVEVFDPPVDPVERARGFRAPQSFRFLLPEEYWHLTEAATPQRETRVDAVR